jgi:hypothetical protein
MWSVLSYLKEAGLYFSRWPTDLELARGKICPERVNEGILNSEQEMPPLRSGTLDDNKIYIVEVVSTCNAVSKNDVEIDRTIY